MAAFKDNIDDAVIVDWARRLDLDRGWVDRTAAALPDLELKARVAHVAAALWDALGPDFPSALRRMLDAVFSETDPLTGWGTWPAFRFVSDNGLDHPELSLAALERLTPLWSAEFAVRPFLVQHPELTLATCHAWAQSEREHVRRLASEGTRPRLPWGMQLRDFVADPTPVLELLERLRDDPAEYVRRSVANNLNDVAKDHPDRVVAVCQAWMEGASPERQRLVKHALRTLIKQGHPGALAIVGVTPPQLADWSWDVSPTVQLGGHVVVTVRLLLEADQKLIVDYLVRFAGARGPRRKVFKGHVVQGRVGVVELTKRLPVKPVTVRRYYAGTQGIELLINGQNLGAASFELLL